MVIGAHIILDPRDPEADRACFRNVPGFDHVDALRPAAKQAIAAF